MLTNPLQTNVSTSKRTLWTISWHVWLYAENVRNVNVTLTNRKDKREIYAHRDAFGKEKRVFEAQRSAFQNEHEELERYRKSNQSRQS